MKIPQVRYKVDARHQQVGQRGKAPHHRQVDHFVERIPQPVQTSEAPHVSTAKEIVRARPNGSGTRNQRAPSVRASTTTNRNAVPNSPVTNATTTPARSSNRTASAATNRPWGRFTTHPSSRSVFHVGTGVVRRYVAPRRRTTTPTTRALFISPSVGLPRVGTRLAGSNTLITGFRSANRVRMESADLSILAPPVRQDGVGPPGPASAPACGVSNPPMRQT